MALKERGHRVVLASSGKPHHVDRALDLLDARDLADGWTTSEDVEETKPAPDLLQVALKKIGEPIDAPSVVIGDSVYDVEAAKNAGMPAIVVRSGGFGDDELREAGAIAHLRHPGRSHGCPRRDRPVLSRRRGFRGSRALPTSGAEHDCRRGAYGVGTSRPSRRSSSCGWSVIDGVDAEARARGPCRGAG